MTSRVDRRKSITRGSQIPRNRLSRGGRAIGQYADDAYSLAMRTAAGLNAVRKLVNIETKAVETLVSTTFDYNGAITSVSQIAQGSDISQRVGDSIKIQKIELRFTINTDTGATTTAARIILLRDLDNAGTIASVANVLQNTGSVNAPNSPFGKLYLQRFSILFDETVCLSVNGNEQYAGSYIASHPGHIRYLSTTANAAGDGKGTLYVILISDRVTTLLPTCNYVVRLFYTDD